MELCYLATIRVNSKFFYPTTADSFTFESTKNPIRAATNDYFHYGLICGLFSRLIGELFGP